MTKKATASRSRSAGQEVGHVAKHDGAIVWGKWLGTKCGAGVVFGGGVRIILGKEEEPMGEEK